MNRTGIVIKSTGSRYLLSDSAAGEVVECRLRGRLRLDGSRSTNPVVVGDLVDYQPEGEAEGTITALHPRRNYIIRRASNLSKESHVIAANIDQAFLVVTLTRPVTNCEFIDRFLVTAEAYHIPALLLLNKVDLYTTAELRAQRAELIDTYTRIGYEVVELTASGGGVVLPGNPAAGIEPLRERLAGRVTLLSGNSGVGKSTLLRAVDPSLDVRIGEISDAHHKGRHTTTFSQMFPLCGGGWLIDTPGIKGFGLIDIEGGEICRYFPELFRLSKHCAYNNCTHTHEPDCAVKEALLSGEVSPSRYESYLKLLDDDEKYRR